MWLHIAYQQERHPKHSLLLRAFITSASHHELQVDQTSEAIEAQPQAAAPKQSRRALKLGKGRSHYNTQSLFEHVCFAANIRNSKRIGVVLGTALNLATGKYMDSLLLGYKICLAIEVSP